jgi:hypothetical protein
LGAGFGIAAIRANGGFAGGAIGYGPMSAGFLAIAVLAGVTGGVTLAENRKGAPRPAAGATSLSRPVVAPLIVPGGGGVAAALTF